MTSTEFEPLHVQLTASDREVIAKKTIREAPNFGSTLSFSVDTFVNLGDVVQVLQNRARRFKAHIFVQQLQQNNGTAATGTPNPQTSPGAVTNVTNPFTPLPGLYMVNWTCELSGTLAAPADVDNFNLAFGNTNLAQSANLAVAGDYPQPQYGPLLVPNGTANTLKIRTKSAGTAGSIYSGTLSIVPVTANPGIIVLNSKREPLLLPIPEGLYIQTPQVIPWESRRPCYATLIGSGPITVSVKDESYDESE